MANENMESFEQMCLKLGQSSEQETFDLQHVRTFFMALHHLWGDWLNPKQLMSKSSRPEKIFKKSVTVVKTATTTSAKPEESEVISRDVSRVDLVDDRRKSIPENADRAQTSEDTGIPADEEMKSDRVESDEEGLVQSP